jgi:hypothetical protein
MSKFLLNLILQIFKALVYSKIKILFGKEFFSSLSAHPVFRPSRDLFSFSFFQPAAPLSPLGLGLSAGPAHPHGPTDRLLPPPTPEPSAQATAASWPPTTSTERKIMAASLLLHSPIKRNHFPSSIPGNRCLQSRGIETSSTPAIEGTRPPRPQWRLPHLQRSSS